MSLSLPISRKEETVGSLGLIGKQYTTSAEPVVQAYDNQSAPAEFSPKELEYSEDSLRY